MRGLLVPINKHQLTSRRSVRCVLPVGMVEARDGRHRLDLMLGQEADHFTAGHLGQRRLHLELAVDQTTEDDGHKGLLWREVGSDGLGVFL